jgi:type I restriction enzyme M protein
VLFFDRKPASETPWTKALSIDDLRNNQHFTLKQNPVTRTDLDEFVACYHPENRYERAATWSEENPDGRWRAYDFHELMARDKANLPEPAVLPKRSWRTWNRRWSSSGPSLRI